MNLAMQLKFERKKMKLSVRELSELLINKGISGCSVDSIKKWESQTQTAEINIKALSCLSNLYGVSVENLVDENVGPMESLDVEFFKLGQQINEYCDVHDATGFFQRYQVFDKNEWLAVPKYDVIMRIYEDYLKGDNLGVCSLRDVVVNLNRILFEWPQHHNSNSEFVSNLHTDSAGYVDIEDKRDPVNYMRLRRELEALKSDLGLYLEIYDGTELEVDKWKFLEN